MKQYLFLATAIATASFFTGCSNNEYVGDQPDALNGTDGAIVFSMGKANTTRAGKPAKDYFDHFYVYGEKTVDDVAKTVFDTYKVKYINGSTSASNTTGWEYVDSNPWVGSEKDKVNGGVVNQTIKYWDYSASKYTFYAFSAKPGDVQDADAKINVSKINPSDESYTVTIKNGAEIEDLYFADKKVVDKADYVGGTNGNTTATGVVQLTFRNLASKIRVGFYETVPGYSIQINNMYTANGTDDGFATNATTGKFVAVCKNTLASQDSKITVKYSTESGKENRAYVEAKNKQNEAGTLDALNTLTLGGGVFGRALNTTSSSPTWDNGGNYTFFWPQTGNDKPLKIKVDYTLTATDQTDENKKETITVKGATATVPKEYVAWEANTAYTYIFKISDKTNGSTGGGAPEGLYPITFDAVVVDYANEGFTTTVSTPSVTAKQDGTTNGYESVNGNGIVFKKGETIDLKVMNGADDVTSTATITGGYINSYDYGKTPEQNLTGASIVTLTGDKKLEGKGDAGYWVLKVTYSNGETNVFTYVIIRVGDAEVGPANPPANP